jgi:hypothetical protein
MDAIQDILTLLTTYVVLGGCLIAWPGHAVANSVPCKMIPRKSDRYAYVTAVMIVY